MDSCLHFLSRTLEQDRGAAASLKLPCVLCGSGSVDADALPLLGRVFELDMAVNEGIERVVAADADVIAGPDRGAALADENRPSEHQLAVAALHAQALASAIASIARRSEDVV